MREYIFVQHRSSLSYIMNERSENMLSTTDRIDYVWGKNISGTLDGAAGIGGLLYVKVNGTVYVPFYDAYGNVMGYRDAEGNVVAEYVYDAFGRTVAQNGTMADMFAIRYSTKYYDKETGLYYYGKRHCSPEPMANGISSNPGLFDHGDSLLSSIGTLGNLMSLSSLSPNSLANFQSFVDAMTGKGMTPNADVIARLRELYDRLKRGPVVVHGILEYEVCVCKGKKTAFERQEDIKDKDEVWDGSDPVHNQD